MTTEMNTAKLRNLAYEAAQGCNWEDAANLYQAAVNVYPSKMRSELAQSDISAMQAKIKSYRARV